MDSRVINVFVFVYLVFGRVVRPIFMDLVGPFLAFLSVFWVVRDRNDLECGNIQADQLYWIYMSAQILFNIGQTMLVCSFMVCFRLIFKKQIDAFTTNAKLNSQLCTS